LACPHPALRADLSRNAGEVYGGLFGTRSAG
jgi:hypothetical protein